MLEECRQFIDSLYPKHRTWTDKEIVDVMVYFNEERWSAKYVLDMVIMFDGNGQHVKTFGDYEEFVKYIGGNKK